MKHTITLSEGDIHSAVVEKIQREHPKLCDGMNVLVQLDRTGKDGSFVATINFEHKRTYPNPRD